MCTKKKIEKVEKNNLFFRRSIYAFKNIIKGEKFSKYNLICLRPSLGISANNYFKLLGKKSKKNINKSDPIKKNYL